jgi:glutathione S-transferase
MSSEPSTKKQRTQPPYELLYHPGVPGRGEHIRLLLEASNTPYTDVGNESKSSSSRVYKTCVNNRTESSDGNPPVFSPPALRVIGAGRGGEALVISQTPNILAYVGEKVGMAGEEGVEGSKWHVAQVALTALDLNNEVHDTHHPLAVAKYYEDQKDAALEKARDVREHRFPKFFSYFSRVLEHNKEHGGEGKYFEGSKLSYADTTVWQVLDGCFFAFPKEMAKRKEEFPELLGTFYENVKEEKGIKEYLASGRRLEYSMGIFRHYPELDRQ